MRYPNVTPAVFLARPNRFVARVEVDGAEAVCHVKNTGRCRELLLPGVPVLLEYHPKAALAGARPAMIWSLSAKGIS